MTDSIDGVDRRLSRFRQETIIRQLVRHQTTITSSHQPAPVANRETPDAAQVIGIPLFVMRTPAWRRQDWAEPQQPPTSGTIKRRGKGHAKILGPSKDRYKDSEGYIRIFCPDSAMADNNGYAFEHRVIMAQHIGRPLTRDEVVHHENQIRDDNSIQNLRLFASTREHAAHHQTMHQT